MTKRKVTEKQKQKYRKLVEQTKLWKSKMEYLDRLSAALEKEYAAYKRVNDTKRMKIVAQRMLNISKKYNNLG